MMEIYYWMAMIKICRLFNINYLGKKLKNKEIYYY